MPTQTEFFLAEAALQTEMLRRKIEPPAIEDDLSEMTEGYLADLFASEKVDMKKAMPIKSTFLTRMREENMARTPHVTNVYIGTNGVRQDEDEEVEESEAEAPQEAPVAPPKTVDEGERALKLSFEQRMKHIQSAVRKYGILEGCDYWPIATYDDHIIASDWYTGKFYRFDYSLEGNEIKLQEPTEVMETFVDVSEAAKSAPFQLLRQRDGKFRWLAISSNTYKDSYKENFSKESLEEAVGAMQKSGDHGELRLEHVLTSRVGDCDFSKVLGNFLVESGTFDTTPRAKKVIQTLQGDEEGKWKVSIGFFYNPKYLVDGEYKSHVRIHERSITQIPANTVTAISLAELGGSMESADTKARLAAVLGGSEEMADEIISELRNTVVPVALGRKEVEAGITASAVRKDDEAEEEKGTEEKEDEAPPEVVFIDEDGTEVRAVRADVVEELQGSIKRSELKSIISEVIGEQMTALRAEVLKDMKKETNSELPRTVKYRMIRDGRKAETVEEHKEAEAVKAGINGNVREEFWKGLTGGHPSN